jgi:signal peptidase I
VVVFNYPEGDTVDVEFQANASFNALVRQAGMEAKQARMQRGEPEQSDAFYYKQGRKFLLKNRKNTVRPVDKRENYIKRCVAIAGDKIEIKEGLLYVNGAQAEMATEMQYVYHVLFKKPMPLTDKSRLFFKTEYNVNFASIADLGANSTLLRMPLTAEMAKKMEANPEVKEIKRYIHQEEDPTQPRPITYNYFPNHKDYGWTEDNFGPLVIPAQGMTINLDLTNLPLYYRAIQVYEHNEVKVRNGKIFINGEESTAYTFKMNYYWLMGDNRHNSADSRFWGFVPEDHVVGKASFVWLSIAPELPLFEGGLRFDKMFRLVE